MKTRLEEVEAQLKRYRESYMGELPEQLDSNLRILDRLQEHFGEVQQNLSEAKIRLVALQNDAAAVRDQPTTVVIGQSNREETNDIDQMKAQLESLLTRYTERHPDVVRLKARIQEIEKQAAIDAQSASEDPDRGTAGQDQPIMLSPQYRTQYTEITQEMRRLQADIEDTKRQIGIYQARVENTPKREQELLSLRRDYQNIQTTYDSLLERKLESEIAVNMEHKQKGEAVQDLGSGPTYRKNRSSPTCRSCFSWLSVRAWPSVAALSFCWSIWTTLSNVPMTLKRNWISRCFAPSRRLSTAGRVCSGVLNTCPVSFSD